MKHRLSGGYDLILLVYSVGNKSKESGKVKQPRHKLCGRKQQIESLFTKARLFIQ